MVSGKTPFFVTGLFILALSVPCVKVRDSPITEDNRGKRGFHHNSQDFREESITEAKGSILYF